MLNWTPLLLAFGLAILAGAWLNALLKRRKGAWSVRRRVLTAASPLAGLTLIATLAGLLWLESSGPGTGENMGDLAFYAAIFMGVIFGAATLAGGLIGAVMVEKGREP